MAHKYVVLGAGRQGTAAAYDLARFGDAGEVVLADVDDARAGAGATRVNRLVGREVASARVLDIGSPYAVESVLEGASACISAVHYTHNLDIARLAIASRVHMTDFGGNTGVVRSELELDDQARAAGVTIVPDCGMGPGLNVSLATYVMSLVETPREVRIWDGGLPQRPEPPWNYVATFALAGLTNEYDGSATFVRGGRLVEVPCFSDVEPLDFPAPIGRLEAFVTSGGLSTAPWTFRGVLDRLENKTLRYPGHAAQFKAFRDLGLLDQQPIDVAGVPLVPREVLHALLEPRIGARGRVVRDVAVMRVTCSGETAGRPAAATVEVVDRYDEATGFTAMQRLTGWHASIMCIAAVEGRLPRGVISVERALAGAAVAADVRRRGIEIVERTTHSGSQAEGGV
jgi:lysine 6-dehydrogenase